MKIVNLKTFLAMPAGTVYSKFEPCIFGELCIKEESLSNDWFYQDIADAIDVNDSGEFGEILCRASGTGESIPMNFECLGRDGCFEDGQMFAVFERDDVVALIKRLDETIACPKKNHAT